MCLECTKQVLNKMGEVLDTQGEDVMKRVNKLAKLMQRYFDLIEKRGQDELEDKYNITNVSGDVFKIKKAYSQDEMNEFFDDFEKENARTFKLGQRLQDKVTQNELVIGLSFSITDDLAVEFAKKQTGVFISNIDPIIREEVTDVILIGIRDGLKQKDIASKIAEITTDFKEWRSMLIANMETMNAFAYGKDAQFSQYTNYFGAPGWKRSFAQSDGRTRAEHVANAEMGRIPYQNEFKFGDLSKMQAPYDYNCRCSTQYSLFNPDTGQIR